jgi:hypothetical protein
VNLQSGSPIPSLALLAQIGLVIGSSSGQSCLPRVNHALVVKAADTRNQPAGEYQGPDLPRQLPRTTKTKSPAALVSRAAAVAAVDDLVFSPSLGQLDAEDTCRPPCRLGG